MDVSYPCVLLLVISASTGSAVSSPSSSSETTSSGPSATSVITTGSSTASTNVDLSPSSSFETTAISVPPSDSTLLTEQLSTATVLGVTPRSSFETLNIIPSAPTSQLLTSSTSFPTSATRNPETTNQPQTVSTVKPNIERAMFKLTFDVTVNLTFNTDLEDKTTTMFKQYEREFKAKLTEVYLNIPGFVYVEIIGFKNGSIKCNHTCRVNVTAASAEVKAALNGQGNVTTEMKNKRFFNRNIKQPFSVNITEVEESLVICKAEGICPKGFKCSGSTVKDVRCDSPCTRDYCNTGWCYVDLDGQPHCRCKKIPEKVVYSGDRCEEETDVLMMDKGAIAGISGGVGGGVIVLLAIALGCMCYKRKVQTQDKYGYSGSKSGFREADIYLTARSGRDEEGRTGNINYAVDIKDRYSGRSDRGPGYGEWWGDQSGRESNTRSRADDFQQPRYVDNVSSGYQGYNRRDEWDQMHPADLYNQGLSRRSSGLGTSHYNIPEDMAPDYDHDVRRQTRTDGHMCSHAIPGGQGNYSHLTTGQSSRSQPSLLTKGYRRGDDVYSHIDINEKSCGTACIQALVRKQVYIL
ncbi:uncharacterized protein LOC124112291 [Haliotis rufescens]|uniref:uncharacterized protein LOC124112291 n=1 Tax=Haliotis rufescens TaxID=6454 RepID=UPI00201F1F6A|nr:uncharacterized protein LOC124112291 [Haliotis rufescens]